MYNSAYTYSVILLSAGSGSRMKSNIPKQYMTLKDRLVINYSLDTFENNDSVSSIVIVSAEDDIDMVKRDIVGRYGYSKVTDVVAGGKERYESVYNGLCVLGQTDYVMIHDGARPFISDKVIRKLMESVVTDKACIPAVKSKDTIRISDDDGFVKMTPKRENVWNVQTPQVFAYGEFREAFDMYMGDTGRYGFVTDDAMIWEAVTGKPVRIVEGDYNNIKITTPEDIAVAEGIVCASTRSV